MNITLFTSNNIRHNYLINSLSNICEKLFVVQEIADKSNNKILGNYKNTNYMKEYFKYVNEAQIKFFGNSQVDKTKKNIEIFPIKLGEINDYTLETLSSYLKSNFYLVFGSSYIKGSLVDFLIKKKTLNIHMGISPYYRGSDCNFWALYDGNPQLVGATIHLLSKGLDSGPILYHALSELKSNPFEYSMSTVKSAFDSIIFRLKDKSIFNYQIEQQDAGKQIRYSKKNDFNDEIIKKYFNKKIDLNHFKFDQNLLKNPFFLKE